MRRAQNGFDSPQLRPGSVSDCRLKTRHGEKVLKILARCGIRCDICNPPHSHAPGWWHLNMLGHMSPSQSRTGRMSSVRDREAESDNAADSAVIHFNWHLPGWELGPQLIDICCKTIANWPSRSDLFSCNAHIKLFINWYRGTGYFTNVNHFS